MYGMNCEEKAGYKCCIINNILVLISYTFKEIELKAYFT